jgi:hypothetical protein
MTPTRLDERACRTKRTVVHNAQLRKGRAMPFWPLSAVSQETAGFVA